MKIKRLLAGIIACAMAVSAMAFTVSAEEDSGIVAKIFIQNQGGSDWGNWQWVNGDELNFEGEESTVELSFNLKDSEFEAAAGDGDIGTQPPHLGIQLVDTRIEKAGESSELTYKIDAFSITVEGVKTELEVPDEETKVLKGTADKDGEFNGGNDFMINFEEQVKELAEQASEDYVTFLNNKVDGFEATVTLISYSDVKEPAEGEEPEGEEPGEGEGEGEDEDDDEEIVNPIIGKTFIQNQGGGWEWYDSGDTEFEGEGSTIDVSLDLTNPEIKLYDPVEDWEGTPNLGIQVADVRVDEAGKSTEFSYKVDAASIVVDGERIDLDVSEYAEETKVTTLGKQEEWGISGGDTMISLKDQVEALADEAGVSYMEYLATIDSLDATITLISYSGAVVDAPADDVDEDEDKDTKTPDAKNPTTGAGGIVAVVGMSALALTAVTVSRKRK